MVPRCSECFRRFWFSFSFTAKGVLKVPSFFFFMVRIGQRQDAHLLDTFCICIDLLASIPPDEANGTGDMECLKRSIGVIDRTSPLSPSLVGTAAPAGVRGLPPSSFAMRYKPFQFFPGTHFPCSSLVRFLIRDREPRSSKPHLFTFLEYFFVSDVSLPLALFHPFKESFEFF